MEKTEDDAVLNLNEGWHRLIIRQRHDPTYDIQGKHVSSIRVDVDPTIRDPANIATCHHCGHVVATDFTIARDGYWWSLRRYDQADELTGLTCPTCYQMITSDPKEALLRIRIWKNLGLT